MKKDPYIFISYKREEISVAKNLKNVLEDLGYKIWWDEDIQCGQVWNNVLDEAIKNADCVVVLWSKKSIKSRWVMHEASSALNRDTYAPLRIDLVPIESPFDRYQVTDLLDWNGSPNHNGILSLKKRISELVPEKISFAKHTMYSLLKNRIAILTGFLAVFAISLLLWQNYASKKQISELSKIVQKLENTNEHQIKISKDIDRIIHPIQDVEIELSMEVIKGIPEVDDYVNGISKLLKTTILNKSIDESERLLKDKFNARAYTIIGDSFEDRITEISFDKTSILAPKNKEEMRVWRILTSMAYSINFYKDSINQNQFEIRDDNRYNPDLKCIIYTDLKYILRLEDNDLRIIYQEKKSNDMLKQQWTNNGRIISVTDLMKSWLFLKKSGDIHNESYTRFITLKPQEILKLKSLRISMSRGRRFNFDSEHLIQHNSEDGIGYYSLSPENWIQDTN